jgi:hypothetical protein
MPVLVVLLFWASGGGPDAKKVKTVDTLLMRPVSEDCVPLWGMVGDRVSLENLIRRFFPEETAPDVDFDRNCVLFLLNGPEGGQYAGYGIQAYRADYPDGITVFCGKGGSSSSGQLVSVSRFKGEAVFFFQ